MQNIAKQPVKRTLLDDASKLAASKLLEEHEDEDNALEDVLCNPRLHDMIFRVLEIVYFEEPWEEKQMLPFWPVQ